MKYAIFGEDASDAETVKVLVRRIIESANLRSARKMPKIKPKGYNGWSELIRKCARDINALVTLGYDRFIVCVDADGPSPAARKTAIGSIIRQLKSKQRVCAVVPVQEIEAWILADIDCAGPYVIPSWLPKAVANPEKIQSPKEELRRISRDPLTKKARYNEVIHNEKIANHLQLDVLKRKCASFIPLHDFVRSK